MECEIDQREEKKTINFSDWESNLWKQTLCVLISIRWMSYFHFLVLVTRQIAVFISATKIERMERSALTLWHSAFAYPVEYRIKRESQKIIRESKKKYYLRILLNTYNLTLYDDIHPRGTHNGSPYLRHTVLFH